MNDNGYARPEAALGAGLLDATREPTVSMHVLRALIQAVQKAGLPRERLLSAAELEEAELEEFDRRIARSKTFRICELALDLTGDPALALHWAERLTAAAFVPVSHLIAHATDLRQGFASLAQFSRLLADDPCYELRDDGDRVTLLCRVPEEEAPRVQRFVAEMVVGSFFHIFRAFSRGARFEQVSFSYAAPDYHDEYTRIFESSARFEQPFTGIVFEPALLEAASPHKDEDVHEALSALAERRMSRLAQCVPFALRVREFLTERGWPQRVDMQTVARSLGLSVRTLRRRLSDEGKSYQDVENDALAIVAKHLLRDKGRSIQETAYEMGFSDTTTFHRAFKRWTGTTPSAYRESL
jgi:AraC-like DNA-binding protein